MKSDYPVPEDIPGLRQLWQEAFGDEDRFLDAFFAAGFDPQRCRCIHMERCPAAALYWFPCTLNGEKFAYLYAVATRKAFRHRGLAGALLQDTAEILCRDGCAGAILCPAEPKLQAFYRQFGYEDGTWVCSYSCEKGQQPLELWEISGKEYGEMRKALLPPDSVVQDGVTLRFLATQAKFYQGAGFLLCGIRDGETFKAQEYLGKPELVPGILAALGMARGEIRGPGKDRLFTMYRRFNNHGPVPGYFGLALD